jgi:hypothetical protein
MADQAGHGAVADVPAGSGVISPATAPEGAAESFHGRPVSWVAVSIIMVGFLVGGLGLVFGPAWWAFWTGVAVSAVGGLLALSTGIFDDWY